MTNPNIEQTKDYEEGKSDERKRILELIELLSELDSCPYCSAIMKQSHYCDNCQQRVSVPTDLLALTEELKSKILGEKESK